MFLTNSIKVKYFLPVILTILMRLKSKKKSDFNFSRFLGLRNRNKNMTAKCNVLMPAVM